MSSPYVGEIRMFGGNFAPAGWAFCDGSLLAISEYDTLFNLIGTTYGGDGQSTFAVPNLQSRVPVHMGTGFSLAETGGTETVTLTSSQIPSHTHAATGLSTTGNASSPSGAIWAASALNQFASAVPNIAMSPSALGSTGGSQPHDNMSPYLVVNFIISLYGIFPSQT